MDHKKVLVVEEDSRIRELICNCLLNDFQTTCIKDIPQAFSILDEKIFDLVVLNTHNQKGNSIELCRRLKIETSTKVVFVSNSKSFETKELCFESGADDYLIMPFFPRELNIRIKKLLDEYVLKKIVFSFSPGVTLNLKEKSICLNKCTVFLSPTEFLIFEYMCKHNGYHKPENLLNYISTRKNKEINLSALIVMVKRLRDKLEKGTGMELIKTRYGLGYYIGI